MSSYSGAARYYDLLYGFKDYDADADLVATLIRAARPGATTVLDVGCGTGRHAHALAARGFRVDGIDLEPEFVERARARCPDGTFALADMTTFDLGRRYDAVVCLFSAIGYAMTVPALERAIARCAAHLEPGGALLVEPWFEPGYLTHGYVSELVGQADGLRVTRSGRTLVEGDLSVLEFRYLVERPGGTDEFAETHVLGLFSQAQMEDAFRRAGLAVRRIPDVLRGLYVAVQA
jgi:SAM-dependent methyltransferase